MTTNSEWCIGGLIKERARSKEELIEKRSYAQQHNDPYDRKSFGSTLAVVSYLHPNNQNRPNTKTKRKFRGPGRKRPKVRCSKCGRLLTLKAFDHEPYSYNPDIYWKLPKHKAKKKQKRKARTK